MDHEAYIQPKQPKKKKKIWIPLADENSERTQNAPPQKTNRTKSPIRLKKRFEFLEIRAKGHRKVGRYLCLDLKCATEFKFGITASKKFGNSPERNRFKRLVREAIRSFDLLPLLHCNVVPRSLAKKAKLSEIQKDIKKLLDSKKNAER